MILKGQFLYPYKVFTFIKHAIQRSFQSATLENKNITLPSLVGQWENYNIARYRFIREIDTEKVEVVLTLMAKEYNFANPNFKVADKQLENSLANLAFL